MGGATPTSFVGRARELDELRTELAYATSGRGRLMLVSGEPGIGKTRLAEEVANLACSEDVLVAWGRCWEGDGAPAFWPWVQVIRRLMETVSAGALLTALGTKATYVTSIVPEIAEMLGDIPPGTVSPESNHARFFFFDAVTTALKKIAESRPLLVVLDDLHWADRSSLLLLEFAARELSDARILAIGTYREGEARCDASVSETIGGLSRVARTLPLRGLTEPEVGFLMERRGGREPDARLVAAVHESTDGNPFFVDEIVRLLAAEGISQVQPGRRLPIPEGLRAAVCRRIARLPGALREVLSTASVIGREFGFVALEKVWGCEARELLAVLAPAYDAGLIVPSPGRIDTYAFSHAVIREALYENLAPSERLHLHRRIAEVLEDCHAAEPEPHVAEIAYHFVEAAVEGDAEKAIEYSRRAGERALELLAYDEAVGHFERALQLRSDDAARRCALLIALGDALWRMGESGRSRESFLEAAEIARAIGLVDLLARAALGLGLRDETGVVDDVLVAFLESASSGLPEEDGALRARVLARLAHALYFSAPSFERRDTLSIRAVEMAKRIGDPGTIAFALLCRIFVLWGPGSVEERLSLAGEVVRLAREAGNVSDLLRGRSWKILALLELGDAAAVDREIESYERESSRAHLPYDVWYLALVRSVRAFLSGDFTEGERLAMEAAGVRSQADEHGNALMYFAAQLYTLRREQGRLAELGPALIGFATEYAELPIWRCGVALFHCEQGDLEAARRELDDLAANDFAIVRADGNRPPALAALAEACNMLGDATRAEVLYRLLLPLESRNIVVATSAICYGPAARYLGLLATTLDRLDEAERHFADSAAMCERMGARSWAAHTQHDFALMLLVHRRRGDRERAAGLLASALSTARSLGMKLLESKILSAVQRLRTDTVLCPDSEPPGDRFWRGRSGREALGGAALEPSRFHRTGAHWVISHDGMIFRLKDGKGLRFLEHLLRNPGLEWHAVALAALTEDRNFEGPGRADPDDLVSQGLVVGDLGHSGELLDARAKAAYRSHLEDLLQDVEEATRSNDALRVEKAGREIEFLRAELSRAVGLGGRDRKAGAAIERARVNVTRAIRTAMERIADFSPALHTHLSGSIRTGTYCSYQPAPGDPVSWAFDP